MEPKADSKRKTGRTPGTRQESDSAREGKLTRFESLLSGILASLEGDASTPLDTRVREALELVTRHYRAQRVEILRSEPTAVGGDGLPSAGARVALPLMVSSTPGAPAQLLFCERGDATWSQREKAQLGLVANLFAGALRQREFELELLESQVWLFMALESATIGTWDWDLASDRVRYITPFDRYDAVPEVRETSGGNWFATTHPEDVPAARAEVERAVTGDSDGFAIVVRSQNPPYRSGEWIRIYSRGRVVERDASGRATRIMGVHEDVTESKKKEEADRAREATLAQASRLLSLSALTSSIAHEINQPLAALTSFLQAAKRLLDQGEEHREEVEDAIERSITLAERASEIVRRLRRLLRREQPLRERIDLPNELMSVRDQLVREARAAGVELRVLPGEAPLAFLGDRIQIEQALVNLVRNGIEAVAASERNPRVVTLEATATADGVQLRVSDNGPGILESARERLFEPFFTTKSSGSGLGLVVCDSIAELHGGRARLDRTGPEGSSFVLDLPLSPKEVDPV